MRGDSRTKVLYNMILSLYSGEEAGLLSMWRSKIKFRNDVWQIANALMDHIKNTHSKCTMGCTLITVHLRMGDYSGFIARHKVFYSQKISLLVSRKFIYFLPAA